MEWAITNPTLIENLVLLATNAFHSPWGIAFNEAQRMAIEADPTWENESADAGQAGMAAARAVALLSYRNYHTYQHSQSEDDHEKSDDFKASSYQKYQGEKLVKRFNVHSYWYLSKAMDSHQDSQKPMRRHARRASDTRTPSGRGRSRRAPPATPV